MSVIRTYGLTILRNDVTDPTLKYSVAVNSIQFNLWL